MYGAVSMSTMLLNLEKGESLGLISGAILNNHIFFYSRVLWVFLINKQKRGPEITSVNTLDKKTKRLVRHSIKILGCHHRYIRDIAFISVQHHALSLAKASMLFGL